MEFDCGASGFLKGCNPDDYAIFEMDILGTGGRLRIIESGTRFELYQKQAAAHHGESPRLVKVLEEEGGFKDFLLDVVENVVESLEDITLAKCPGVDGLKAVELAYAIRESAEKSQKIYCSKC
jgi:predicted dehydrogenase